MTAGFGVDCPCGSGDQYHACCGPLHDGDRTAATAEELMRSRYAAYSCGDADYVFRTWHPRTRPTDVAVDAEVTWLGLDVTDTAAGGIDDDHGEVEFAVRYEVAGREVTMRERSRFQRRAGRWLYVDGVVTPQAE